MKKIRNLVLILAIFLGFNGCEKNPANEEPLQHSGELTVNQAQAFVEMQRIGEFTLKSGIIKLQTVKVKADWTKAKSSSNDEVSVVETEILAMGRFGFATPESMEAWKTSNNEDYLHSISRLVVIRMKKTGEMHSFIMSVIGDKLYFESKKFKLQDNSYLKREKDLTGFVLFHDLTGKFVNGWIYCDGQITNSIVQPENLDLPIELKSATMMIAVYTWTQECTDYYYATETSITYNYTKCTDIFTYLGSYSTGGGDAGNTGGGGTPGGYTPPAPQPCNCTNICPVCGKCLDYSTLKSASLPDGTTTTTTTTITMTDPCEYCAGHPVPAPVVDVTDIQTNAKAYCIYQKLINGGILSGYIGRYFGITAANQSYLGELNLTWTLGGTSAAGETLPIGVSNNNSYYSVEIRINESTLDSKATILIAMTMLHEALHAKLIAEYYDTVGSTDFKSLYSYYRGWGYGNIDTNQEAEMLHSYSNDMASALQSFDQGRGINHSLSFYTEAVKYSLASDIFYQGYYPSGEDEYFALFDSSKDCN